MKPALPLLLLFLAACTPTKPTGSEPADNSAAAGQTAPLATLPLAIRTAKGEHRFTVEVARTPQEQEQGLMFRTALDADGGMLFPMSPPRTASFWMKNTVIPLDILFIRTDGTIAFIKANATPYSREPVSAGIPVAAVLELRGGHAAELGIAEEDVVSWGACAVPGSASTDLNFCPAGER